MVSAEQPRGPTSARDGAQGSVRLSYHPPLLRPHGGLHDVTSGVPALKSGDIVNIGSDVRSKENVVAVAWGDSVRPVYHAPLLRSHGGLHDMTGLMMKSGDVIKVVESDVHAKENVVAVAWGDSVRPVYHVPLLRSHGALHDATSGLATSGEVSDVNSKNNIVLIGWG